MDIDDILNEWKKDATFDRENIDQVSINAGQLHHKYRKMYAVERIKMRDIEANLKKLKVAVARFISHGVQNKSQIPEGWVLPPQGKVTVKDEVKQYVDINVDVVNLTKALGDAHDKLDLLESIETALFNRRWEIKNAITWMNRQDGIDR